MCDQSYFAAYAAANSLTDPRPRSYLNKDVENLIVDRVTNSYSVTVEYDNKGIKFTSDKLYDTTMSIHVVKNSHKSTFIFHFIIYKFGKYIEFGTDIDHDCHEDIDDVLKRMDIIPDEVDKYDDIDVLSYSGNYITVENNILILDCIYFHYEVPDKYMVIPIVKGIKELILTFKNKFDE